MRRFIESRTGRAIGGVVIAALLVPFFTMVSLRKAYAQLEQLPTWAVVEFANLSGKGSAELGRIAAEAVSNELGKLNKYDVLSGEQVNRSAEALGLQNPITRISELIRLGQDLRAVSIVRGEIVDWQIATVGAGRQAEVAMRIVVIDVASGLPVNGSALKAVSAVRTGDVSEETLLNEALAAGAFNAVRDIESRTLPTGTVLNTLNRQALINQGSRTGFQVNQEVIVTRGREQVATARVTDVEPDSATITVVRQIKGIQPGDRVRVVFAVPEIKGIGRPGGELQVARPPARGNNSALITVLIVLGVLAFLLGQGRSGGQDVIIGVRAEPLVQPDDTPAVRISWRTDAFVKGNQQRYRWQVWRSDVSAAPVAVADGFNNFVIDDARPRDVTWNNFNGIVGPTPDCRFTDPPGESTTPAPGLVPGTPYLYSVELVYRVSALDLPLTGGGTTGGGTTGLTTGGGTTGLTTGGGTTGLTTGGGTTGGLTTGGGTTGGGTTGGGTTGGGGTAGGSGPSTRQDAGDCYFLTTRVAAIGTATPFNRPQLRAPENGATVSSPPVFRFDSVRGAVSSVVIQYALQFSPDPTFPENRTTTVLTFVDNSNSATLSTRPVPEAFSLYPGAQFIYWRVGARNVADNPGPVLQGRERYIFSAPFRFERPTIPPNPPAN